MDSRHREAFRAAIERGGGAGLIPTALMWGCFLMAVGSSPLHAQFSRSVSEPTATLKVQPGPYYADIPIDLFVEVVGFDPGAEQPACEPPVLTKGTLTFVGVRPSRQSFYSSVNGRVTQGETVTYTFQYRLVVSEAGPFDIGAFSVTQGKTVRQAPGGRLSIDRVQEDSSVVAVKLLLPEVPVFVGQAVEVVLEWTLSSTVADAVGDYDFTVPIFDATDRFRFIDPETEDRRQALRFKTIAGEVTLPYTAEESQDRKGATVLRVKRMVIPLRDGTVEFPPTTVVVDQVTRWKRDLFGRSPASVRKLVARDLPRRLVVQPVPSTQRPATYAGAIGSGYRLEVSADRTVVQVGDPLKLTLALSGDGLLEAAGAPRLDAPGNLQPSQFRVASDRELGGTIEDGVKTFVASVRVLDEALREIPPIEYAWFNPTTARFETTRSEPIALRVRRGTLVTADDVVGSTAPSTPNGSTSGSSSDSGEVEVGKPRFTLTGAELSLVQDPALLLRRRDRVVGGMATLAGLYGLPALMLGLAWVLRRRAAIDPSIIARRKVLEEQVRHIEDAASMATREAAARTAQALRSVIAEVPSMRTAEVDALIASCDAVVYAPANEAPPPLAPEVVQRSLEIARNSLQEGRP